MVSIRGLVSHLLPLISVAAFFGCGGGVEPGGSSRARGAERPQSTFLITVTDCSVSMRASDPDRLAEQGLQLAFTLLGPKAQFGAVSFNNRAWIQRAFGPAGSGEARVASQEALIDVPRVGGANLAVALRLARTMADRAPAGAAGAIVLITDGKAKLDSAARHEVEAIANRRVPIYTVKVGEVDDRGALQAVASKTGGVGYSVTDGRDLLTAFVAVVGGIEDFFVRRGPFQPATVLPGTRRILFLVAKREIADGRKAGITSVSVQDVRPASAGIMRVPGDNAARSRSAIEVLAFDSPGEGVWLAEARGRISEWMVIQQLPFELSVVSGQPRYAYVDGQTVRLGLRGASSNPRALDGLADSLTASVEIGSAGGHRLLSLPLVPRVREADSVEAIFSSAFVARLDPMVLMPVIEDVPENAADEDEPLDEVEDAVNEMFDLILDLDGDADDQGEQPAEEGIVEAETAEESQAVEDDAAGEEAEAEKEDGEAQGDEDADVLDADLEDAVDAGDLGPVEPADPGAEAEPADPEAEAEPGVDEEPIDVEVGAVFPPSRILRLLAAADGSDAETGETDEGDAEESEPPVEVPADDASASEVQEAVEAEEEARGPEELTAYIRCLLTLGPGEPWVHERAIKFVVQPPVEFYSVQPEELDFGVMWRDDPARQSELSVLAHAGDVRAVVSGSGEITLDPMEFTTGSGSESAVKVSFDPRTATQLGTSRGEVRMELSAVDHPDEAVVTVPFAARVYEMTGDRAIDLGGHRAGTIVERDIAYSVEPELVIDYSLSPLALSEAAEGVEGGRLVLDVASRADGRVLAGAIPAEIAPGRYEGVLTLSVPAAMDSQGRGWPAPSPVNVPVSIQVFPPNVEFDVFAADGSGAPLEELAFEATQPGWTEFELIVRERYSPKALLAFEPTDLSSPSGIIAQRFAVRGVGRDGWDGRSLLDGVEHRLVYRVFVSADHIDDDYQGSLVLAAVVGGERLVEKTLPVKIQVRTGTKAAGQLD